MDPDAAEALRKTITTSQTYLSCLVAILIYDWVISFQAEYERFWEKPWSFLKVVFLWNRYFGLATVIMCFVLFNNFTNLSNVECERIILIEPIFVLIMMVTAELILIARVFALYERKLWVLCLFAALLVAECAISIWALIGSKPVPIPDGAQFKACIATGGPKNANIFWVYWLPPLILDSVIIALTLYRIYQIHARASRARIPILNLLVRDGLAYYSIVFAANVLNVVAFRTRKAEDNQALNAPLAMVLTTLAASRLCLSMRDPAHHDGSVGGVVSKKHRNQLSEHAVGVKTIPTYPLDDLRMGPNGMGIGGLGGSAHGHEGDPHTMIIEDEEKKIAFGTYAPPPRVTLSESADGHDLPSTGGSPFPGVIVKTQTTHRCD